LVHRRYVKGAFVTLLLLIRHGTNDWVHGRLAGWTPGVHLNDDGRRQAAALSARLAALPIDAIYASPLDRTVETAQAIAGPRGMPLRLVEGLGEVKYGEWQGAELKELYKHELWPGVQFYPSGTRFPGGETLGEAQMRMVTTLDALRAQYPKGVIAVVSHADIIKLALAYYIGMHIDLFQRLEISPCSVSALFFTRMGPRLLAYNDIGSLEHLKPKPEPPAEAVPEAAAAPQAQASPATVPAPEHPVLSPEISMAETAPARATEKTLTEQSDRDQPDLEAVSSNGVDPPEVPPGEHQVPF
jgi:probable phosphomutase (TIGR03848 family)